MKNMSTEEYKQLWKETFRKCEMESNKKEAKSFISHYFDKRDVFDTLIVLTPSKRNAFWLCFL
jgi:hypothetical protein